MPSETHSTSPIHSRRRVLVIGIDGATLDIILPLVDAGKLPNLARLMENGCWGPLRSTIPPVTAPAWTSFMTGVNPGRHGLFDFRYRLPDTYKLATNNTTTIRAPMLWEVLSQHDKRCCIMHVPASYPPRPINGEWVTGLLTPADAEIFTYPADLTAELLRAIPDYQVWPASMFHPIGRERAFLAAADELTELRTRLFHFMQSRGDWDFQMIVFMAADQVQHAMWHHQDPTHPLYDPGAPEEFKDAIDHCYQRIDSAIGVVLDATHDDTTTFIISDHGFGPVDNWFHINAWLLSEGLMVLKPRALTRLKKLLFNLGVTPLNIYDLVMKLKMGKTVANTTRNRRDWAFDMLREFFVSFDDVDWSKTVAYSMGNVGPIFVNLAGREPEGCVAPENYVATLEDISRRLKVIVNPTTGEPLVTEIHFGKDIYAGKQASSGPDIMIFMRDYRVCAYGNTEFASNRWLTPSSRSGWHRMHGTLIASGLGIQPVGRVENSRLWDIYPTVMALMGLPLPRDLDGRVLKAIITQNVLESIQYGDRSLDDYFQAGGEGYSEEEETQIAEHLKGLGYV